MLSFDLKCPYRLLSGYLDYAIDNAFGPERYETHGVSLKLVRRGESFLNIDGNIIFLNVIADIEVFKDVGLFSTEIKGVIDVSIAIEYDINSQFKIYTKSQILLHKWVEKPKLEIGHLNMPVEKLVELALKHYEGIITAKLDAAIQEKVDLKSIVYSQVNTLNKELIKKSFHGITFKVVPTELQMEKPNYFDTNVLLKGGIVLDTNISSDVNTESPQIKFAWIEKINPDNLTLTHIELNEDLLLGIMLAQISEQEVGGKPLKLENPVLTLNQSLIELKSDITSPIKASFSLTAIPDFNESNQLFDLKDIHVKIDAVSLIYKLSAPLVNKFIESKLDAIFPVNLKELVENGIKNNLPNKIDSSYGTIKPNIEAIDISKLNIQDGLMKGILRVKNSNISIELNPY